MAFDNMWKLIFWSIVCVLFWFIKPYKRSKIFHISSYPFVLAIAIIVILTIRFIVELIQPNDFPAIVNFVIFTVTIFALLFYAFVKNWNQWIVLLISVLAIIQETVILERLFSFFQNGNIIPAIKNLFISSTKLTDPALLSTIGTLVTTILILLTLFEYRAQRKSSYLPKIILPSYLNFNIFFNRFGNDKCNFLFPNYWDKFKYDIKPSHVERLTFVSVGNLFNYKIACRNIGNGNANAIRISWNYNLKKMIRVINNKQHNYGFEVTKKLGAIIIKNPDGNTLHEPIINTIGIDQIAVGECIEIEFPRIYFILSNIILYQHLMDFKLQEKISPNSFFDMLYGRQKNINSLFPLEVKIEYNDLENHRFEQVFLINIPVNSLSLPKDITVVYDDKFNKIPMMSLAEKKDETMRDPELNDTTGLFEEKTNVDQNPIAATCSVVIEELKWFNIFQ